MSPSVKARLIAAACVCLVAALSPGTASAATKLKVTKRASTVTIARDGNFPIPDAASLQSNGLGVLTAKIGGPQLRRARIRDVDATLQTTGTGVPGPGGVTNSALNLQASLTAPDGTTVWLVGGTTQALVGDNVGPLTLDDQSPTRLGGGAALQGSPTLTAPYNGRAQPDCFTTAGLCSLSAMNDGRVSGTWTLRVYDVIPVGFPGNSGVNVLNGWSVRVRYGKPYEVSP